jgi:CHAD domain-containing protein
MGFRWSRDDRSIGEGFRRIAREQIGKAIEEAGDEVEAPARRVHEARRRAKKLRALLRLVRPDFGHYARENALLRDAARSLSTARDAEVAEATLHSLLQWAGHAAPARVAAPDVGEAPELAGFAAKMQEMLERTEKWKPGKVGLDTLLAGLANTYRSGCEAMALVGEHPTDTAFHEWRKHAKYHWNQLKLLEGYAEQVVPAERKAAGDLADLLGLHHDLAVLRDMIGRDAAPLGEADPSFVLDAAQRRRAELEAEISALGRQVYAETPKALQARFRSYLEGWAMQEAAG